MSDRKSGHEICTSLACSDIKCIENKDKKFEKTKMQAKKLIMQFNLAETHVKKLLERLTPLVSELRQNGVFIETGNITGI